jgi:hypothetical protein
MKKLIAAGLLLASTHAAQATVDTGKWLLEFDNGWEVTMNMDNFNNSDSHFDNYHGHQGNGIGGTNFIDIDTGNAATTLTGSAYDGFTDQHDHTFINNFTSGNSADIYIMDYKVDNFNGDYAYNYLYFAQDGLIDFNETNSFYDNLVDLVDLVGVSSWRTMIYAEVDGTVLRNVSTLGITLTSVSQVSAVPVPGAVWLMGTALIGLVAKRKVIKL